MNKLLKYVYNGANIHLCILVIVFFFSFTPKIEKLYLSDFVIIIHLIFLSKKILKKNIIVDAFFRNENFILTIYFFLFFLFSTINLLISYEEINFSNFKLLRLFVYFFYLSLVLNIFKKNLKNFEIISYYQITITIVSIISLLFIIYNLTQNNIFLTRQATFELSPLGHRMVDLSGYNFNLKYIGNTVNSFGIIIFTSFVVCAEKYLLNKKNTDLFFALFFFSCSIFTFSQGSLISILIYLSLRIAIFIIRKYNFIIFLLLSFFFIIIFIYLIYLFIDFFNFYLFGLERLFNNLQNIIINFMSDEYDFPETFGDRIKIHKIFFELLASKPEYLLIGFGLLNGINFEETFILESSLIFSLFFGGVILFTLLNIYFFYNFFRSYNKMDYNIYTKITFFYFPSFYLMNLISFQAFFNISIFIFFFTLNFLAKFDNKNIKIHKCN